MAQQALLVTFTILITSVHFSAQNILVNVRDAAVVPKSSN